MKLSWVFETLDLDIPEERELYERNENNFWWIDSTWVYSMNLPKNFDWFPEVKSEWSGESYIEWTHILPMKVLIGFWVDDDGIPWNEWELWRMWEALQLLQFAIVKAMKLDAEKWFKRFENCHELLKKIEKKKKRSGVLRNWLRDIDDLIEFLENYINGISRQTLKNTTKKVRRRSRVALEKTADVSEWEWNEWAILWSVWIAVTVAGVMYLALTDKTYTVRVWEMSSTTTITVQEKQWLERNYTIRQHVPDYDWDYVFKPDSGDIVYSETEYDDATEELGEFERIKHQYSPTSHFRLGEEETINWRTISIDTWVIETIARDCPEPEALDESLWDDNIYIPSWWGNQQDYIPSTPSQRDDSDGNGFGFWSWGSINKASFNPFWFLVSAARAQWIEENCDIENEITLSAPIKYDVQNYSYWDFWNERPIRNPSPIIWPIPEAPEFIESEDRRILHDKTHVSYFLSLFEWETERLLRIPNQEDWIRLSSTGICEITKSQLRYILSGTTQSDLEACIN